jgi:hypothetical protein
MYRMLRHGHTNADNAPKPGNPLDNQPDKEQLPQDQSNGKKTKAKTRLTNSRSGWKQ